MILDYSVLNSILKQFMPCKVLVSGETNPGTVGSETIEFGLPLTQPVLPSSAYLFSEIFFQFHKVTGIFKNLIEFL